MYPVISFIFADAKDSWYCKSPILPNQKYINVLRLLSNHRIQLSIFDYNKFLILIIIVIIIIKFDTHNYLLTIYILN